MKLKINIIMSTVWLTLNMVAQAGEKPLIVLQSVGDVPTNLTTRISGWLEESIGVTSNAGAIKIEKSTLRELAESIKNCQKNQIILILANRLPKESQYVISTNSVVVLSLDSMRPSEMSTDAAKESFARHVETESVGGVASALGLPGCRMIRCALYPAHTQGDLDAMSRNLCPPCAQKLAECLKRMGLKIPTRKQTPEKLQRQPNRS